jgi:F-type H+-transporting ATPase subunit b
MGPDWFTVIAQIINFLILVALLKRFLYGPIVRAMDRREAEISSRLDAATKKAADAEQERVRFEALSRELAGEREEMLARARDEAVALRQELLEKVRQEADRSRDQWRESFRREQEAFFQSLRSHISREVCAVAHRVVTEMADTTLQERMAVCLERRVRELDLAERDVLAGYFRVLGQEIVIRSSAALDPEARSILFRILEGLALPSAETQGSSVAGESGGGAPCEATPRPDRRVRFEVDHSLVCGIEICCGGRSLAWNLEDYLGELEQRLMEAMGDLRTAG